MRRSQRLTTEKNESIDSSKRKSGVGGSPLRNALEQRRRGRDPSTEGLTPDEIRLLDTLDFDLLIVVLERL